MAEQHDTSFGDALRRALKDARLTQAELAKRLTIDPGQVSRWINGKAMPHPNTVQRIEEILEINLSDSFTDTATDYELYVSAPITALRSNDLAGHHDVVARIITSVAQHVDTIYWPGELVRTTDDLIAADLATERNMKTLAHCSAYLYLQFSEIIHPSSALVELGFALGRRLKTTLIIKRGLHNPYMLEGFGAVAASLSFLPKARIYYVNSVAEAEALINKNGRELLGLA